MDGLGFFQKTDIPAALGTMDQDFDFGFSGTPHNILLGRRFTLLDLYYLTG
jgi:hypothetical protein